MCGAPERKGKWSVPPLVGAWSNGTILVTATLASAPPLPLALCTQKPADSLGSSIRTLEIRGHQKGAPK